MRNKRKYTRKKKPWKIVFLKKLSIYLLIWVFLHVLFINAQIVFSSPEKSDIIVIIGNEKQNSQKISINHKININQSIQLFQKGFAEKILILSKENNFWIDENKIITEYLMQNDVWWGSIASENTSVDQIWKNTSLFLQQNEWGSVIIISNFSQVWMMKSKIWSYLSQDNIFIQPTYIGIYDSILWIVTNYYYFWKI